VSFGIVTRKCRWLALSSSEAPPLTAEVAGWALVVGCRQAVGREGASDSELLDGHVGLDVECLDRIYLNGYVETCASVGRWCCS